MVASITLEAATDRMQRWLTAQPAGTLLISDWVRTEVSSALSLKVRTGILDPIERLAAAATFRQQIDHSFIVLPVTGADFQSAARYADRHDLGLRAGDALHLAIAAFHGATLLTLDRRLHAAALALGYAVETV